MLRMVVSENPTAAMRYYSGGLLNGDYYGLDAADAGTWNGQGAARLQLSGSVTPEAFAGLCRNSNPLTGQSLTARTNANRRVGYDINFHCPKSVSLLHALNGDSVLVESFREAVGRTMRLMEAEAKTRVRIAGAQYDRLTGNLTWATFVHTTARPIGGVPDPHLHAHCFVFNATFDTDEGRWKAGQFGDLKRDAAFFEACFHAHLSGLLREAGYGIERRGRFWEIAGIPQELIEKFSRRTAEIEAVARKKGIVDPTRKAELGAKTRRSKDEAKPKEEVRANWNGRLGLADRAAIAATRFLGVGGDNRVSAREALDFALAHAFERASVVAERTVLETALRFGVGFVSPTDLQNELAARPLLRREVDGRAMVSTREILEEEQTVLDFARNGRGSCRPFEREAPHPSANGLSKGQQAALSYLLNSTDRVMVIRGRAGTGKTSLMREAVSAIEKTGISVHVFAPSAEASRGGLRREGFSEAETVAKLLQDPDLQRKMRNQVIWIDEAGLLGTKSMHALFDIAERQNARVILSGDSGQHRSVERGDALRLLERYAGLGPATLHEIRRQSGDYKSAVEAIAEGRVVDGFSRLEKLGAIREVSASEGRRAIAEEYARSTRGKISTLIVSPTHAESREVTATVREHLKSEKLLGKGKVFERLERVGLNEVERADGRNYQAGQVVQFHKAAKGFKPGEKYEIMGRDPFGNVLARKGLFVEALPLSKADRFDVFERKEFEVAKGDVLRITRNGRTTNESFGAEQLLSPATQHRIFNAPIAKLAGIERPDRRYRLENGSLYRVSGFTLKGDIKLENGYVVSKDFGHLAHGYCVTSHASQGKTVDRVLVAQPAASLGAASAEQFYVSVSRGRERVTVFTDDKAKLLEAVSKSTERPSATELVQSGRVTLDRWESPTSTPEHERRERGRER